MAVKKRKGSRPRARRYRNPFTGKTSTVNPKTGKDSAGRYHVPTGGFADAENARAAWLEARRNQAEGLRKPPPPGSTPDRTKSKAQKKLNHRMKWWAVTSAQKERKEFMARFKEEGFLRDKIIQPVTARDAVTAERGEVPPPHMIDETKLWLRRIWVWEGKPDVLQKLGQDTLLALQQEKPEPSVVLEWISSNTSLEPYGTVGNYTPQKGIDWLGQWRHQPSAERLLKAWHDRSKLYLKLVALNPVRDRTVKQYVKRQRGKSKVVPSGSGAVSKLPRDRKAVRGKKARKSPKRVQKVQRVQRKRKVKKTGKGRR